MTTDSSNNGVSITTNGTGANAGGVTLSGTSTGSNGVDLEGPWVLVFSNDGNDGLDVSGSTTKITAGSGAIGIYGMSQSATGTEIENGATVSTTSAGLIDINPQNGPIRVETGGLVSASGALTLETTFASGGSNDVDVLTGGTLKSTGGPACSWASARARSRFRLWPVRPRAIKPSTLLTAPRATRSFSPTAGTTRTSAAST